MKKVLSVFLAISLALSVFLVMPVSAEYHTFKQFSLDSSNEVITYEDSFWDNFGENLIKDPTIAAENFDSDGNYMRYAKITADYQPVEINLNHWWDKYVTLDDGFVHYYECMQKDKGVVFAGPDENGYYTIPTGNLGAPDTSCHGYTFVDRMARSLANRTDVLLRDGTEIDGVTFNSLTDDGSGVIRIPGVSNGASRRMPLPAMEENSYYVVKFKMLKNQDIQDTCILLELEAHDGYYHGGIEPGKGTHDYTGNLGNGQADTVVFLVYTGDKSFSDPCIDIKNTAGTSTYISFDDFGMYKVSEEYAAAQVDGVKLTDYEDGTETVSDPSGIQVCVDSEGNLISYSDSFWNSLGENLIPDPTVANFVDDGNGNMVYGRYSKITADYKPADVDARYWWDKYIDEEQGFTYYYKNKVRDEGAVTLSGPDENGNYTIPAGSLGHVAKQGGQYKCDGTVYNPMLRSPANRADFIRNTDSLTDDGSGVIYAKAGGAWRALPLPTMEANSYYVVKYNMRINELFINPDLTIINLGLRLTPPSESTPAENDISNPFIVSDFYEGIDKHTIPTFNGCFNTTDTFTVAFMVYTGSNSYTDPCIDIYLNTDIFLDDFGMYKVSEEYAAEQLEGVKLTSAAEPEHEHTGGTATCHSKAVCTVCGAEYGEFDANNHDGGTEVRDAVEANCTEAGYTGDTYCLGCSAKIADGEAIEAGHTADHWKCGKIATTEEDGLRYKICDVCGTRFGDEVVPKIVMPVIEPGDGVPEIVVESKTAPAGSTVDVKISLKNNPGIASMKLTVEYDEGLTLKAPVAYDIYPEEADPEMPQVIQPAEGGSPIILNWVSPLADVNGDLVYATLTFEVAAEAEGEQNITVTYNPNDIYNLAEENIGFAVTNGKITVGELSYIRGDINGDGEVDNKDLTRLFQYLSNWDVAVNEPALDVNGDSSVDNKDLTRLFQYLSNWDVVIY